MTRKNTGDVGEKAEDDRVKMMGVGQEILRSK